MEIYIAICCDRHIDEVVRVFTTQERAIKFCEDFIGEDNDYIKENPNEQELTDSMRKSGWLYYRHYSTESDYVRVEKGVLDPQE